MTTDKPHEMLPYAGSRMFHCKVCRLETKDLTDVARHVVENQWTESRAALRLGSGRDMEQRR